MSTFEINIDNYKAVVDAAHKKADPIVILAGAHGNPGDENLVAAHHIFTYERLNWKAFYPEYNVRVEDIFQLKGDYPRIHYIVNLKATIICGWCYSDNNLLVKQALTHKYSGAIKW